MQILIPTEPSSPARGSETLTVLMDVVSHAWEASLII